MPFWALWRRNWAVWMMPLTGLIVATVNSSQLKYFDSYPYWMAAQKTYALTFLGMLTCLAGAAEGAWQRRSHLLRRPSTRSSLARFGIPVAMTWLPTAALLLVSVAAVGGGAAWQMWTTSLVSLFAWTCLGFALGTILRSALALPLSVVAAFGWFAFTPAIEPPWPRHLSATWAGCCTTGNLPSTLVMVGIVIVAFGLTLTAAGLVRRSSTDRTTGPGWVVGTMLPTVASLVIAGFVTHEIAYTPTQPRIDRVVCWRGDPEICLWPERQVYGDADVASIRTITGIWAAMGVHLPRRLSEDVPSYRDGTSPLVYNHTDTPAERVHGLAQGLATGCETGNDEMTTGGIDYFGVKDWLVYNAGLPGIDAMISDHDALKPLLAKPRVQQVELINKALSAMRRCR